MVSTRGVRAAPLLLSLSGQTPEQIHELWYARRTIPEGELRRVANQYLDPTKMQLVIVGDAAKLRDAPEIRALCDSDVRPIR